MEQAIRDFAKQFAFSPEIINRENLKTADIFVLVGMGGSHLAGDILLARKPEFPITIWSNYGLPKIVSPERTLIIISSYSGDTEETLDAFETARKAGHNTIAISKGGELLRVARENKTPFIELPKSDIPPRSALGFSLLALIHALGEKKFEKELSLLQSSLFPDEFEKDGKKIADQLYGFVPVIYSYARNSGIAYNWKIKFNETGKIPAFSNIVPELNHNEMNGFDATSTTRSLCDAFSFIFIESADDDQRTQKRLRILKEMYTARGLSVISSPLDGKSFQHLFSSLLTADWAAFHTALLYKRDPLTVPMIREFKVRMKSL